MQNCHRNPEPLEIDGSTLEGGGQLVRISAGLAAMTGTPIHITKIRAARHGGGGLKAQHLACVKWLAEACNAHIEGAEKGSKEVLFVPGSLDHGVSPVFKKKALPDKSHIYECHLNIGTSGATTLALQAILPFVLFNRTPSELPVHLTLTGGTNTSNSPSYDYVCQVLLPTLRGIGFPEIKCTLHKRGWFWGGSSVGSFTIVIPPRRSFSLAGFTLAPTSAMPHDKTLSPARVRATVLAPQSVHGHMCTALAELVPKAFVPDVPLEIMTEDTETPKRCYLLLILELEETTPDAKAPRTCRLARDCLLTTAPRPRALEKQMTQMIESTLRQLQDEWKSGAWADEFMRDQLVIYQGLASGTSQVCAVVEDAEEAGDDDLRGLREPSLHARTAEWVVRKILGVKFDADGRCNGIGFGSEEGTGLEKSLSQLQLGEG